jgi:predicted nucleic-acid-binding Zn-ribbon protein
MTDGEKGSMLPCCKKPSFYFLNAKVVISPGIRQESFFDIEKAFFLLISCGHRFIQIIRG